MKRRVAIEDINKLTEIQKQRLREIWSPEKYDMAFAEICKDVVNESYDYIEFVIGEMRLYDRHKDEIIIVEKIPRMISRPDVTLQRLRLINDKFYENKEHLFNSEQEIDVEDDEFNFEYEEPEDFFGLSDCLPLPDVGQLIEMLNHLNTIQGGYSISIPDKSYEYSDGKYKVHNMQYDEQEDDELCNLLWSIVVEML